MDGRFIIYNVSMKKKKHDIYLIAIHSCASVCEFTKPQKPQKLVPSIISEFLHSIKKNGVIIRLTYRYYNGAFICDMRNPTNQCIFDQLMSS